MMTRKKLIEDKKLRVNLSPKAKRITLGATSLLGAGIMLGGGNSPVKASAIKEDVVVENKTNNLQNEEQNLEQEVTNSEQTDVNNDHILADSNQEETIDDESAIVTSGQDQSILDESDNIVEAETVAKENVDKKTIVSNAQTIDSTSAETSVTNDTVKSDPTNATENISNQVITSTSQESKKSYQDSLKDVENINAAANATIQDAIDKLTQNIDKLGGTVTIKPGNQVVINTTVNGIEVSKAELEKHIKEQINNFDNALKEYEEKLTDYNQELTNYNTQLKEYEEKRLLIFKNSKTWACGMMKMWI